MHNVKTMMAKVANQVGEKLDVAAEVHPRINRQIIGLRP
jgi:hypothetical protein